MRQGCILFITQTTTTLPNPQDIQSRFASLTGLYENSHKSKALNLTLHACTILHLQQTYDFPIYGFMMWFYGSLYAANYSPRLLRLQFMLATWNKFPISWGGKIAYISPNFFTTLEFF